MSGLLTQLLAKQGIDRDAIAPGHSSRSLKKWLAVSAALAGGGAALGAAGAGAGAAGAAGPDYAGAEMPNGMESAPSANAGRFRTLGKVGDAVLKYGAAAGDAYDQYRRMGAQDRMKQLAEQEYGANAPLRSEARRLLMDNSTPDTSAIFNDPYDPTGRYRRVVMGSRG